MEIGGDDAFKKKFHAPVKYSKLRAFLGKSKKVAKTAVRLGGWTAALAYAGGTAYKQATKGRKYLYRNYGSLEGANKKIARGKLHQGMRYDI